MRRGIDKKGTNKDVSHKDVSHGVCQGMSCRIKL